MHSHKRFPGSDAEAEGVSLSLHPLPRRAINLGPAVHERGGIRQHRVHRPAACHHRRLARVWRCSGRAGPVCNCHGGRAAVYFCYGAPLRSPCQLGRQARPVPDRRSSLSCRSAWARICWTGDAQLDYLYIFLRFVVQQHSKYVVCHGAGATAPGCATARSARQSRQALRQQSVLWAEARQPLSLQWWPLQAPLVTLGYTVRGDCTCPVHCPICAGA